MAEQFRFQPNDPEFPTVTVEQAIYQGLGAASTCWESMEGTGVFDSERAVAIGEEITRILKQVGVDVHAQIPYPDDSQSIGEPRG